MSTELPHAFISHCVPGRLRIRIPAMRHQDLYFERLRQQMVKIPGLHRLTTNTRTGSVLLEFKGELQGIEDWGRKLELFELGERPYPHALSEWLHNLTSPPENLLKIVTDGRIDVAGLTALALTGLGIRQVMRGHALPAGYSLIWDGVSLIRDMGKPGNTAK